jgi:hypothetical protein
MRRLRYIKLFENFVSSLENCTKIEDTLENALNRIMQYSKSKSAKNIVVSILDLESDPKFKEILDISDEGHFSISGKDVKISDFCKQKLRINDDYAIEDFERELERFIVLSKKKMTA